MKVLTNIHSGSMVQDAFQAASNVGNQVSGFFHTAEGQAEGVTSAIFNQVNTLWQSLASFIKH